MLPFNFFYKRAPLLKLTERGGMHPYITVGRGYGGVKTLPYLLLSFVKFFRFRIAHCRNLHSKPVGRYACGIERLLQQPAGALREEASHLFQRGDSHFSGAGISFTALRMRAMTSSLGISSVMSNICGPRHAPTTARRKAFITLPR